MKKTATLYIWFVSCLAVAMLTWLAAQGLPSLSWRDCAGLLVFGGLAALAEKLATEISVGPQKHAASSIAFLPLFACVLVYPALPSILVAVAISLFTEVAFRKPLFWRATFNAAQVTLAYGAAALTYAFLADESLTAPHYVVSIPAFWALAGVFFITNIFLVSV